MKCVTCERGLSLGCLSTFPLPCRDISTYIQDMVRHNYSNTLSTGPFLLYLLSTPLLHTYAHEHTQLHECTNAQCSRQNLCYHKASDPHPQHCAATDRGVADEHLPWLSMQGVGGFISTRVHTCTHTLTHTHTRLSPEFYDNIIRLLIPISNRVLMMIDGRTERDREGERE